MTAELGGEAPCLLGLVEDHRDVHLATDDRPDLSTPAAIHDPVTRFYREIAFDDLLATLTADQHPRLVESVPIRASTRTYVHLNVSLS